MIEKEEDPDQDLGNQDIMPRREGLEDSHLHSTGIEKERNL